MYKLIAVLLLSISCFGLSIENCTVENVTIGGSDVYPAVTIGLFADPHYESNGTDEQGLANIQTMINSFWDNNPDIDFIFCLGDQLTGDANPTDALADILAIDAVLLSCNKPAYAILGNHESTIYDAYLSQSETMPSAYYSFDKNGIHFICLNTAEVEQYKMSETQLNWLENDLAYSDLPTIVFVHHRIDQDYPGDPVAWWPTEPLSVFAYDSGTLRAMFEADGDVKSVLNGHYHSQTKNTVNNITYYTVPSCASTAYCIDATVMSDGECKFTAHNYGSDW